MPKARTRRSRAAPDGGVRLAGDIRRIPIAAIEVGRGRVRRDLGHIGDLAASLYQTGLLNPITVYEQDGRFRLVAGERRLEAAKRLGSTHIDALVRPLAPNDDPVVLELVENLQRRELTDEEEADAFITLVRDNGHPMVGVAEAVGRSVAYISKRIRVFEDAALRQSLSRGHISVSLAEELLTLPADQRATLLARAAEEDWSAHGGRAAIRALHRALASEAGPEAPAATVQHPDFEDDVADDEPDDLLPAEALRTDPSLQVRRERPKDLHLRIRELDHLLSSLRPFQFTRRDDRAMEALFKTLRRIAQTSRGRRVIVPSVEEAQALGRRRAR